MTVATFTATWPPDPYTTLLDATWRGLATRYDKLAVTYRAGVVIAAILTWLRI